MKANIQIRMRSDIRPTFLTVCWAYMNLLPSLGAADDYLYQDTVDRIESIRHTNYIAGVHRTTF